MNLYITNKPVDSLTGVVFPPAQLTQNVTHMTISTFTWDNLYLELDEVIPENVLRYVRQKVKNIHVDCPEVITTHQLNLLVDLFPDLDGLLRKEFMRGGRVRGLLPDLWEYGKET